jgi:hypothetical protein
MAVHTFVIILRAKGVRSLHVAWALVGIIWFSSILYISIVTGLRNDPSNAFYAPSPVSFYFHCPRPMINKFLTSGKSTIAGSAETMRGSPTALSGNGSGSG